MDWIDSVFNLANAPSLQTIAQAISTAWVATIWQSALLACCLALALRVAPRPSSTLRFALWMTAFGLTILLPLMPHLTTGLVRNEALNASSFAAERPWLSIDIRWSVLILAVWAFASIYGAVDLAIHTLRVHRLWRTAKPVGLAKACANVSGRVAELCTSDSIERPAVIGFFSPRILIPAWLYERLTEGELDQIILHETEHLRRGDDWTNLLQKIGLVLFPLNPVLFWMDRRLALEREMACDEGVIRKTNAPRAYATCLTNLAERGLQHRTESLSLGAWHRRAELARRVHSILGKGPKLHPVATTSLMILLGGGLIAGSVEMARWPQLVVFAPSVHRNGGQVSERTPVADARLVRTSFDPRPVDSANLVASGAHSADLKAMVISPRPTKSHHRRQHSPVPSNVQAQLAATDSRTVFNIDSEEPVVSSPQLIALQEQSGAEAVDSNTRGAGEGWVVLATWQHTVLNLSRSEFPSDSTRAQNPETRQPAYATTVTRMILRLIPTSFSSPVPTATPYRSRWLVFQL